MKFYCTILVILFFSGCSVSKKTVVNKIKAEEYYVKAWNLLQQTSHNGLSKALANQALGYIDTAISLDPSESKYFRVKGTSYYHLKAYDLSLVNYNKAIKLDPTNSLALMNRAVTYENTERYALAEKDYLEAMKYDPGSLTIYYNMGLLYGKWGKDSMSLLAYNIIIKMDPMYTSAYLSRGYHYLGKGLYAEAIKDFNMALKLDPSDKLSWNNRGLCKFYLKQYEAAILDYRRSLSIKLGDSFDENFDTDKYAYNNMGNAYFALGNIDQACTYWNIAIQKGYQYKKEWKAIYNIDDPVELVKKHCKLSDQL